MRFANALTAAAESSVRPPGPPLCRRDRPAPRPRSGRGPGRPPGTAPGPPPAASPWGWATGSLPDTGEGPRRGDVPSP